MHIKQSPPTETSPSSRGTVAKKESGELDSQRRSGRNLKYFFAHTLNSWIIHIQKFTIDVSTRYCRLSNTPSCETNERERLEVVSLNWEEPRVPGVTRQSAVAATRGT